MVFVFIGFMISTFLLLRLSAYMERRLKAYRTFHSLVAPLNSYLGLLDHELQSDSGEADRLISQAVLDHVTELRAFLLQPRSRDLVLGRWSWIQRLNHLLLALEESLEDALENGENTPETDLKEQVRLLSQFINRNKVLSKLAKTSVGLVGAK